MDRAKDKISGTSKTKLALGALAATAVVGGAVAGGIALKKHHDHKEEEEDRHKEEEKRAHSQQQGQSTQSGGAATGSATAAFGNVQASGNQGDNKIRYGSRVSIKHNMTGRFLRYNSGNPKGCSGSNQTLVVAGGWNVGDNEYWQVVPGSRGGNANQVITYGSIVRFKHSGTGHSLHSHQFKSISSGQQEVSGFSSSDENDDWTVERWDCGQGDWAAEEGFRLVHVKTNQCLHSHDVKISGTDFNEVTCFGGDRKDENSRWRVCW
jgi:dolichyl-phosphate-mannose--protein O-mannosyl transferase